jgi:ATP-dependent Clp protease ATP-binding subunit ClpA
MELLLLLLSPDVLSFAGDVILFIDEVHILVEFGTAGRGNKGSGLDIANLLKPLLGRGQLQVTVSHILLLLITSHVSGPWRCNI